jgi:hypothetical protein
MGLELNAVRAAIYARLTGDATLATYVGTRIYVGAAPQGTQASGMYCVALIESNQNLDFRVARAHGGVLWDPVKVRVMVWNEVTDYANLGAASDRVGALLDTYSVTTGGYDFYSLQIRSVEDRIVEKGGAIFLGAGYEFVCFVQKSGLGFVEASKSYLAFGPNGGEYNFTGFMYTASMAMVYWKHIETRVDEGVVRAEGQTLEYALVMTAPYTAAIDAALFGQIKLAARSLIWGPEGNASGKRKYTSLGAYLAEYWQLCPEEGPVTVTARIEVSGDLTQGVF